jgi:hypothetical protein
MLFIFPAFWKIARKFLIDFPSSYCVEKGFSTVVNLLTKKKEIDWKLLIEGIRG